MLQVVWETVFGSTQPADYSWLSLDDQMRKKLRVAAIVLIFALLLIIALSLYFYFQLPPIRNLVTAIISDVSQSIEEKGAIPQWLTWVGSCFFILLLGLTSILAWTLVDLGRMHRKIDRITFRAVTKVTDAIVTETRSVLNCVNSEQCAIQDGTYDRTGRRPFMTHVFYWFANKDMVGSHEQKDMRRQVFALWSHYYIANFIFITSLLITLWFLFLVLINALWLLSVVIGAAATIMTAFWIWKGCSYRKSAVELASHQVRVFHREEPAEFKQQAKAFVNICGSNRCPLL